MVLFLSKILSKRLSSRIKFFIWDVDGTLYQSTEEIFGQMCKLTIEFVVKSLKIDRGEVKNHIYQEIKNDRLLGDIVEDDYKLDRFELASLSEITIDKAKFVSRNDKLVKLFVKDINRFDHFILSNSSVKNIKKILKNIGLTTSIFNSIYSMETLGKDLKPSLNAFKKVLSDNELNSREVLMIGDTLGQDLYPAKELGMTTCLISNDQEDRHYDKVDFILRNPLELNKII